MIPLQYVTNPPPQIPPDPPELPDPRSNMDEDLVEPVLAPTLAPTPSFKDALLNKSGNINLAHFQSTETRRTEFVPNDEVILLTEEDKVRIYQPWQHSVIVKLFGKIQDLWKLFEPLTLIDLGKDYYTAKLEKLESAQRILHGGPWFVIGNFLSVKTWEPNFVPDKAKLTHMAIWVRVAHLPTEF